MAIINAPTPDIGNSKNVNEKIDILLNSYYLLRKEIEYALQNVDFSNLSTDLSDRLKKINEELNANATNLNNAITAIGDLETAIADGVITTYYQAEEPTDCKTGDLWFNTSTEKLYRYNGIAFDLIEDKGIVEAVQAAQNAQDTADGKIKSFYQADEPATGMSVGDLWIDTNNNNKLYRYNGTLWQAANDGRIDGIIDSNGKLLAAKIEGIINTAIAKVQNANGTVSFDDRGLVVHDLAAEINSSKAVLISSTGILIANSKDVNGNWVWRTAITGDSISADQITAGTLRAINIEGVNITGSNIYIEFVDGGQAHIGDGEFLVQHIDGSRTRIDGRGITRIFSVPIFTQLPSGTNITDNFETNNIADTRVDLVNSFGVGWGAWGTGWTSGTSANTYIFVTVEAKDSGNYGLKIITPRTDFDGELGDDAGGDYDSYINCAFLNYRPTKDCTFSLRYRVPTQSYFEGATLFVDDLDYPSIPTQAITLTSSAWTSAMANLTANHTYKFYIRVYARSSSKDKQAYIYIDDVVYELNVNQAVITGYTQSEQPYYDFTYIRKGHFDSATGGTQQIVLPDYFKGLNYDVYVMPVGNWNWTAQAAPSLRVDSVNNTVPSFTVTFSQYPAAALDFIYTVVLNN